MNQKRIVIIEGDAFDADAIVAIVKVFNSPSFRIVLNTETDDMDTHLVTCRDNTKRDTAMAVAVASWLTTVGYVPVVDAIHPTLRLPDQPPPDPELTGVLRYWSDEKGRYYETYGGKIIYNDLMLGKFIWNEGPPRRKNPLGPEASPIVKIYVGEDGKPLDPQPN